MRTVTRTVLTSGAMLFGAVAAVAQEAVGPRPAVLFTEVRSEPIVGPVRSPAAVLARLVSFDANADQRVSRDELPERMQGLVARGDQNADAALDSDELRALVTAAGAERNHVSFRSRRFEGLPGVIRDLKLPPATQARALVIVDAHKTPRHPGNPVSSVLLAEMKALLDDEDYENFVAAATRLSKSGDIRFHIVGGSVGGVAQPSGRR